MSAEFWKVMFFVMAAATCIMTICAEVWRMRCYRARADRDYWRDYFFRNDELPKEVRK